MSGIKWRKVTLNGLDLWPPGSLHDPVDHPIVQEWDGLGSASWDAPSGARAAADGSWVGTPRREAKSYMLRGVTLHRDEYAAEAWADKLMAAAVGKGLPLTFHYASGPRTALVRVPEVKIDRPQPTVTEWQFSPIADDPLLYLGDGVLPAWAATFKRIEEIGGMTVPMVVPLVIGSVVSVGAADFFNRGGGGRLEFRIDGPIMSAPEILTINADGVRRLGWPSLSLATGEFLHVYNGRKLALLQGQASRPPVPRQWPRLTAGVNRFEFRAGPGSTGRLTVRAWPAI